MSTTSENEPRFNGICLIIKLVEIGNITVPQVIESHVDHAEAYKRARELGKGHMVFIGSGLL